ncbi:MAG: phospholipid carrier-dependent glycosyltransferase [Oscillospiraceae bacterium]|nr:phospholipid carrier-dependent glycosyltransferase [Oscillospiraceae bacterium]
MSGLFNKAAPFIIVLFIILLLWVYISVTRKRKGLSVVPRAEGGKLLGKLDYVLIVIITIIYAVVAFCGLGDKKAPESMFYFEAGDSITVNFGERVSVSKLFAYCGNKSGTYEIYVSEDGENFIPAGVIEQSYSKVFKWCEAEKFEAPEYTVCSIMLKASNAMSMGELAIYDEKGDKYNISMDASEIPMGALFDEQELVPPSSTFMNSSYFDEVYFPRTAYEFITHSSVYETTHPPLGKTLTSLGVRIFGMNPFGWRFMPTLFGVLMLPALYILLKLLFASVSVSVCMTACFAFDFMHFSQTRLSTIDCYSVFFTILMYLFMLAYLRDKRDSEERQYIWLFLSGLFFGIGASVKWTCIYAGGGLGLIWLYDMICSYIDAGKKERAINNKYTVDKNEKYRPFFNYARRNISLCLVSFVLIPLVVYYLAYIPFCRCSIGEGGGNPFSLSYAKTVLKNQQYMLSYHSGINATHPYSSRPYEWMLDLRPILYYLQYSDDSLSKSCIGCFSNPLICWAGLGAMACVIYDALVKRRKMAVFILLGYIANLLPWFFISRVCFEYHYFPSVFFLTLALGYMFKRIEGGEKLVDEKGRRVLCPSAGLVPIAVFTALCIILFIMFYPVLSGASVSKAYCDNFLSWLPRWPI